MVGWLCAAAALSMAAPSGGHVQMKALGSSNIASIVKKHSFDFRIANGPTADPGESHSRRMFLGEQLAPKTALGLGLVDTYAARRGTNLRPDDPALRTKRPAVTFVVGL